MTKRFNYLLILLALVAGAVPALAETGDSTQEDQDQPLTTATESIEEAGDSEPVDLARDQGASAEEGAGEAEPVDPTRNQVLAKNGLDSYTINDELSAHHGKINVNGGLMYVNGTYGGTVVVYKNSALAGNGQILGNIIVDSLGTIAPGAGEIGVLSANGNFKQLPNSNFLVYFSGDKASLLKVAGTATVEGGNVLLSNVGTYDITKVLPFLEASGGIQGTFATIASADPLRTLYLPFLIYGENSVSFGIKQNLLSAAKTENQRKIAAIIDNIADPTPSELEFINALVGLTTAQGRHALNQIGGQQYSSDLFLTELVNRQFLRRMYDPLRLILNQYPCYEERYDDERECCLPYQVDTWFSASGSRTSQKGGADSIGFKMDGPQITCGVQKRLPCRITAGAALSYEYDFIRYHVGGSGKVNTFLGGVYGLYRPAGFYLLAEASYGYSINSIKRPINMGSLKYRARSTPKISQVTGYVEYGIDIAYEDILIQPFIGFEGGTYWRNSVREKGAKDLNLTVKSRKRNEANTRIGAHFYSGILPTNIDVSLDLAWIRRWTNRDNKTHQHLATLGPELLIEGVPLYLNSFEMSLALSKEICYNLNFFAEFNGEFWKRSVSYYGLGGLEWRW